MLKISVKRHVLSVPIKHISEPELAPGVAPPHPHFSLHRVHTCWGSYSLVLWKVEGAL